MCENMTFSPKSVKITHFFPTKSGKALVVKKKQIKLYFGLGGGGVYVTVLNISLLKGDVLATG
jgi:hypothetical protein